MIYLSAACLTYCPPVVAWVSPFPAAVTWAAVVRVFAPAASSLAAVAAAEIPVAFFLPRPSADFAFPSAVDFPFPSAAARSSSVAVHLFSVVPAPVSAVAFGYPVAASFLRGDSSFHWVFQAAPRVAVGWAAARGWPFADFAGSEDSPAGSFLWAGWDSWVGRGCREPRPLPTQLLFLKIPPVLQSLQRPACHD